ncbi:MAG TPA: hypothetical protein DIU18_01815 [Gemmatimonadetes bacterium]|nr:hypothetical protein [Gemmatimonadota bacterium]|tara:strand:+ start:10146 stop:10625 length:480 start_codon:yes stop_codon:yes gene_type:complete
MMTIDEHVARAPASLCFGVAADVERWPDILHHYRRVRFIRQDEFATGLVEMAAWRPFGPIGWPTWWLAEMVHDRSKRTIGYMHVYGITSGMDVLWEMTPLADDRTHIRVVHEWTGPSWPLIGKFAANVVIGPHFVSAIAVRTLAGVVREAERRAKGRMA